jgi:hypothetical protein
MGFARSVRSTAACRDCQTYLPIGKLGTPLRALGDLRAQLIQGRDRLSNLFDALTAFRDNPRHRGVVTRDDNLLAPTDTFEQFTESSLGFKSGYSRHNKNPTLD